MSLQTALAPLYVRWAQLPTREKNLLKLAAALLGLALVWVLLLAPTLATLRTAEAQARTLDSQLQQMLAMQAQAVSLQKQPPLAYEVALKALTSATQQTLGSTAQITVSGERANVALQGVSADALALWLAQARVNARSTPLEARLARVLAGNQAGKGAPTGAAWNGVMVMSLPAR